MAPSASAGESVAQDLECNAWRSTAPPWRGYSNCTGMLPVVERQQAKLICVDPRGSKRTVYGKGAGNGKTSSASCGDNPNVGVLFVGANVYRV